ncbi:transposase [Streptomyces sp. NPDC017991]|uniref:transposase n=1 Tax=Streptomyces sp. NPDC017991 TaxID=3365026 RepID=UPI0037B9A002
MAMVDSQGVRVGERGCPQGHDGGKRVICIKRHLLVDTRGTIMVGLRELGGHQ